MSGVCFNVRCLFYLFVGCFVQSIKAAARLWLCDARSTGSLASVFSKAWSAGNSSLLGCVANGRVAEQRIHRALDAPNAPPVN